MALAWLQLDGCLRVAFVDKRIGSVLLDLALMQPLLFRILEADVFSAFGIFRSGNLWWFLTIRTET